MTFITLVSLLLLSFGLLGLYPAASRQDGLGGRLLQFGIIVSLIEWTVLIIASGMWRFVIHLTQRSGLPEDGSLSPADFKAAALAVHTDMTAVTLTFIALLPLATIMVGIGLSQRFGSMDIYKLTSYVLAIGGIIGLGIYLTATNAPDMGIQTLLWINSVVLYRRSGLVAPVIDCRSGTHRFRIGVRHDDGAARFEVRGKRGWSDDGREVLRCARE